MCNPVKYKVDAVGLGRFQTGIPHDGIAATPRIRVGGDTGATLRRN
jgi:hypothetical protein